MKTYLVTSPIAYRGTTYPAGSVVDIEDEFIGPITQCIEPVEPPEQPDTDPDDGGAPTAGEQTSEAAVPPTDPVEPVPVTAKPPAKPKAKAPPKAKAKAGANTAAKTKPSSKRA